MKFPTIPENLLIQYRQFIIARNASASRVEWRRLDDLAASEFATAKKAAYKAALEEARAEMATSRKIRDVALAEYTTFSKDKEKRQGRKGFNILNELEKDFADAEQNFRFWKDTVDYLANIPC